MKLRFQVGLAFVLAAVAILGAISVATYSIFATAEVRELDRELRARVQHEADTLVHSDGRIPVVQGGYLRIGALDDHVKFAALFSHDGQLLARSETFEQVPARADLPEAPKKTFDVEYGERHLRAILWPVPRGELLLAASRAELDEDVRGLARLLGLLFLAGTVLALFAAQWLSRRLTRDIEQLATVARRISAGELDVRAGQNKLRAAREVRTLANDLDAMVDSLQSALAAQGRFVSNAAHELRSPLTTLSGELELALRREREPHEYKAALAEALDSAHRLQRLAEDLLDLARKRPDGDCDLSEAVTHALQMLGDPKRVTVEVPEVRVRGVERELSRLFRNLVENAVEHAATTVFVRGRRDGDRVIVDVEDDGAGLDETLAARVFEPFVRGGEERTRSGAGLGLAIAREVAAAAGGSVEIDSVRKPTRFRVMLAVSERS